MVREGEGGKIDLARQDFAAEMGNHKEGSRQPLGSHI